MKLARASAAALALAAVLAFAPLTRATAGDADRGNQIAVLVKGHAALPADAVEVEFTVSATSDDTTEAERRYQERLVKVIAAAKAAPEAGAKAKKPAAADEKAPTTKKGADDEDDDDDDSPPAKKKAATAKKDAKGDKGDKPASDDKAEKSDAAKAADAAAAIPVEVSERGLTLTTRGLKSDDNPFQKMIAMQMGGQGAKADPPVKVSSKVLATIRNVQKLDRKALLKRLALLVDQVVEAGAEGPDSAAPPLVRFVLDNPESLRIAAYKDAVERAQTRASGLAEVAHRKVGRVASIHETTAPAEPKDASTQFTNMIGQAYGMKAGADTTVPPSSFELATDVDLEVDFELAP